MHRFGKPLIMQVFKQPEFMSRAGVSRSALLLLHFLSLAAGTQSRTDDNALRPALREAGSCASSEITNSYDLAFAPSCVSSPFGLAASTVARLRGARAPF